MVCQTNIYRQTRLYLSGMVAFLALMATVVACSNSQVPSDNPGTTPPVWTGRDNPHTDTAQDHRSRSSLVATLVKADGTQVGRAIFSPNPTNDVFLEIEAQGLPPGFHGLHIHSTGKCEPNSVSSSGERGDFLSAGGHFNVPGYHDHPSSGDLPSLFIKKDGTGELGIITDSLTLEDLTAGAGTAIIVHANPDNFANIPPRYTLPGGATGPDAATLATGDAGLRIACGEIKKESH